MCLPIPVKMRVAQMDKTAQRVVARYIRDKVDWDRHVSRIVNSVEELRDLRDGYRGKILDIQRAISALNESLAGSSVYDGIRRELYRASLSLDPKDPRTTSFLNQLDYLTGEYEKIGLGLG